MRFSDIVNPTVRFGAVSIVLRVRFDVATGAWVKSKHMYLIRGSVGA